MKSCWNIIGYSFLLIDNMKIIIMLAKTKFYTKKER